MRSPSRTRTVPAVLIGLVIALTGACGEDAAAPDRRDPDEGGLTTVVVLEKPGAGPTRALRLQSKPGTTTSTLSTKLGLELTVDGKEVSTGDVPTILLDITFTTREVLADGSAEVDFSYGNPRLAPGSAPNAELTSNLGKLSGITGSVTVTDRGAITDSDLSLPDGLPSTVRQTLEGLDEQLTQLAVPLPEEPVGVGAVWMARDTVELSGLRTTIISTYTLTELTATGYAVRYTYEQEIPAQRAELPGLPDGTTADARASTLTGSGTSQVDLTGIVPAKGEGRAGGTIRFSLEQDDETVDVVEVLDIEIGIS